MSIQSYSRVNGFVGLLFAGCLCAPQVFAGCPQPMNEELVQLIDDEAYDQAEEVARRNLAQRGGHGRAVIDLALVLYRRAYQIVPPEGLPESAPPVEGDEAPANEFSYEIYIDPEYEQVAVEALQRAAKVAPGDPGLGECLLNLFQKGGRHAEFVKLMAELSARKSVSVDRFLPYATYYLLNNRRADLALEVLQILLKREPGNVQINLSYADALLVVGQIEKSRAVIKGLHRRFPADDLLLDKYVELLMVTADFAEAQRLLLARIKKPKPRPAWFFDLAVLQMATDKKTALVTWKRYLAINDKAANEQLWRLQAQEFVRILETGSKTADLLAMAYALMELNVARYAVPLLANLQATYPKSAFYPYLLAQAYALDNYSALVLRQLLRAESVIDKGGDMEGVDKVRLWAEIGNSYFDLGDIVRSIGYLNRVEVAQVSFPDIQYLLARAYVRQGQHDKGVEYLRKCSEMTNNQDFMEWCYSSLESF